MCDRIIAFAYLFEKNKGSEFQIGWELLEFPKTKNFFIAVPSFSFGSVPGKPRKISGLEFKIVNKKIIIKVDWGNFCPKTAMAMRAHFTMWIFFCFYILRDKSRMFWFVNLVQVAAFNPFFLFKSNKILVGPVGGQPKLYAQRIFNFRFRVRNFILTEVIYKFSPIRLVPRNRIIFIDKVLRNQFNLRSMILPAITINDEHVLNFDKMNKSDISQRDTIVCYTRDVGVKLPNLSLEVMKTLATAMPDYKFVIIGAHENVVENNFSSLQHVHQEDFFSILRGSRLNLVVSQELAGFVQLEAVSNGCPNCYLNFIPERNPLLVSNEAFNIKISGYSKMKSVKEVTHFIKQLILNESFLADELIEQRFKASQFSLSNKFSFIQKKMRELR